MNLLICTATILAYYDRKKPVSLHVDASSKGLGAALFQDNKPIAFASKALTPAETRYANLERVPEVPQFPAERTYDTIRDVFKAVANSECRSVLRITGVVPRSYYSKFPFVKKLPNLTARAVVNEMKMESQDLFNATTVSSLRQASSNNYQASLVLKL